MAGDRYYHLEGVGASSRRPGGVSHASCEPRGELAAYLGGSEPASSALERVGGRLAVTATLTATPWCPSRLIGQIYAADLLESTWQPVP